MLGYRQLDYFGPNFSEMRIKIRRFSFKKMPSKMSPTKLRPFCLASILIEQSQLGLIDSVSSIELYHQNYRCKFVGYGSTWTVNALAQYNNIQCIFDKVDLQTNIAFYQQALSCKTVNTLGYRLFPKYLLRRIVIVHESILISLCFREIHVLISYQCKQSYKRWDLLSHLDDKSEATAYDTYIYIYISKT